MPTRVKRKNQSESGFEKSLTQLRDIPLLPPETITLVETTATTVGNTDVLAYGINNATSTLINNFGNYKIKYEESLLRLRVSLENICLLHSAELEVSAMHMVESLRLLKVLPVNRAVSLLEVDEDTLRLAKDYVRVTSVWRKNGGRSTWKQDSRLLMKITKAHQHEIDRACDAIISSKSISGPFVAIMDSLSKPLALGAL